MAKTKLKIQFKYSVLQIRASQRLTTTNLWPLPAPVYNVMVIVTGVFSKKSFFIVFVKTGVRNFAIFTGKHVLESLYFNLILMRYFNTGDSSENYKIFMNSFFYGTSLVAAFVSLIK